MHDDHDATFVSELTAHQLPILLYVRSLLPGDPSARDVAQQTNAKIWEKRSEFELGTNFRAWAFSIARFEVLNYRKQQARDAKLYFSDDLQEVIATEMADTHDDIQERHEALKRCLGKLRSRDRELLLHRYASTERLADYASMIGRSVGGLKVTLHRLRSALLECMERQLHAGETAR
ncbi:RNA polymerase sigma factor [Planctomycetes bacterium Pan216]|uniref:RNA polymerase sigma factor n=1 Tax=Kolteria novifilia TaxID=2527975 RepID=A0A518B8L3_9BACT|nr:RNA polymerase sigma factor [Planctomycetes bacterium Pan216]